MKAEDSLRDDAESAEGAGDELGEVVACDVLHDFATTASERAIGESYGHADDKVAQGTKAQAKCTAVIGREDAADSCLFGPKRIEGETLAVLGESFLESLNRAASFDGDGEVRPGVLEDAVDACGGENEVGSRGWIAPVQFCAAAARNDDESSFVGKAQDFCKFGFGAGGDDEVGLESQYGIQGRGGEDVVGAEEGTQCTFVEVAHDLLLRRDTLQRPPAGNRGEISHCTGRHVAGATWKKSRPAPFEMTGEAMERALGAAVLRPYKGERDQHQKRSARPADSSGWG